MEKKAAIISHVTDARKIDLAKQYKQTARYEFRKPNGLWYQFGREWQMNVYDTWNREFVYKHELIIDRSDICCIADMDQLKKFINEFKVNIGNVFFSVDWKKIVQEYKGVEFTNYHQIKHDSFEIINDIDDLGLLNWYWTIEVNSGCIWDLSAIHSTNRIKLSCSHEEL